MIADEPSTENVKPVRENPSELDLEKVVISMKKTHLVWHNLAGILNWVISILGIILVGSSLMVSTFSETELFNKPLTLKWCAFTSSITLTIIISFSLVLKSNNFRTAWRLMASAFYKYEAKIIDIGELINTYEEAEKIAGPMTFTSQSSK